jgi:hypothetical protein
MVDYHVFEHRDGEECDDRFGGGRTRRADTITKDDTFTCISHECDNELVYSHTIEYDESLPEVPDFRRTYIEALSDYERALLLGMTMESIRGSWTQLNKRLGIIGYICDVGVGEQLSDDFINSTKDNAQRLWRRRHLPHKHPDGRLFRGNYDGTYGKLWDEVEQDIETMESLASFIPNDLTWDDFMFERMRED